MPTPQLEVAVFSPGPYATNCYVVSVKGGKECWIIDAGFEPEEMIEHVRASGKALAALILTHAHIDHIAGVAGVKKAFPLTPILIHEAERDWLSDAKLNLSFYSGMPVTAPKPDRPLREGETLSLDGMAFSIFHTPGHSPGSITLYARDASLAFVGDALFSGSIGRTDFPGCSFEELEKSIKTKLYTLPDATRVLPGHGPATTIGREKSSNPYVQA